jgi:8-hydroxy-5-deazaflavin:NADPH oxidoreductase
MNIGIIGTGNMGGGLGKLFASKGHKVLFGSRDPQKAKTLAGSIGPNASGGSIAEAARFGSVVVLAVPWSAVPESLKAAGSLAGKTVLDLTNPLTPDYSGLAVGHTSSGAEEIAKLAPGAHVVKALNTVFAQVIGGGPEFGPKNATALYAGDDPAAKETVSKLIGEAGFDAVDAGPLQSARYLEPMGMLNIVLGYGLGMGTSQVFKLMRR